MEGINESYSHSSFFYSHSTAEQRLSNVYDVIFIVGPNRLGAGTIWARATWGQTGLGPDRPDTVSNTYHMNFECVWVKCVPNDKQEITSFHRSHTLELAAAV
jgi:hypothetical protein